MKLINLKLENFKGIKAFEVAVNGQNISIYGDNATGKTTIADAFSWVLFGKDSQGRDRFGIKTVDKMGNTLHHLEHAVTAVLDLDGDEVELRRVFKEKWTKKRGMAVANFTGHTTDYFINGVPQKEKEYMAFINKIIDENVFKLITSPSYFNEGLKWDERRKLLIETFGNIEDSEILSDDKYKALVAGLGKSTVEEYNKVVAMKKRQINKELETNSIRIDEVSKSIVDLEDSETQKRLINKQLIELQEKLDELNNARYTAKENGGQAKIQAELKAKEDAVRAFARNYKQEHEGKLAKVASELKNATSELNTVNFKIDSLISQNKDYQQNKEREEQRIQDLMAEYKALPKFEYVDTESCPTCGQPLPQEQIEEAREKAKAAFNLNRSKAIEEINERGCRARKEADSLQSKIESNDKEIVKLKSQSMELDSSIENLNTQYEEIKKEHSSYENMSEYIKLNKEIFDLKTLLNQPDEALKQELEALDLEISKVKENEVSLQAELAKIKANESNIERVKELTEKQNELANEYERLEKMSLLIEDFTKDKVNRLENKISSNFKFARFKLYEEQVNGGLKETCEVMFENVPYTDLNNAARINIGLDVINTFSRATGVTAPVFVDNAESVTQLIDSDSQLIRLVVNENYKELTVVQDVIEIKKGA